MCNLYRMKASRAEVAAYFRADDSRFDAVELEKDYVSPGREGWVIREDEGNRVVDRQRAHRRPENGADQRHIEILRAILSARKMARDAPHRSGAAPGD